MHVEYLRDYCLAKKGVTECFPFDEVTLVFKVMSKSFALIGLDAEMPSVNLKCDPEKAIELREHYEGVQPGYHMNKTHWNTVFLEADVPDKLILALVDHSYTLVAAGLPKKEKEALQQL